MPTWVDVFTGTTYEFGDGWIQRTRRHLAELLAPFLKQQATVKGQADAAADFWSQAYYDLVFPLRFSKEATGGRIGGANLFPQTRPGGVVSLEGAEGPLRRRFIEDLALPPILPAQGHQLLADMLLARAACINIWLRRQGADAAALHAIRLTLLTAPFLPDLREEGWRVPVGVEAARQGLYGHDPGGALGLSAETWAGVRRLYSVTGEAEAARGLPDEFRVVMVAGTAQRIKQYVFDTPGLNEIRGASTLLDRVVKALRTVVAAELGPETVLRAAGSTIHFLAPYADAEGRQTWSERISRAFFDATGAAFATAAAHEVPMAQLLENYPEVVGTVYRQLDVQRDQTVPPLFEALPFEARCQICRRRPAEGWDHDPDGGERPVCRVCLTKRQEGRSERQGKADDLLDWLGLGRDPSPLGVHPADYWPQSLGNLPPDQAGEQKLIAVVYGDGNNFGAIGPRLVSLPLALQWTHRVENVTRAAAAMALARATQEAAAGLGWAPGQDPVLPRLPFQVLALGGDELGLFAWGPVGLWFAEHFLCLTDLEFSRGGGQSLLEGRLSYSLGILVSDEKAPVRRTVDTADDDLLKWAKRTRRTGDNDPGGNAAFFLAVTAEQIPGDLKAACKEMYLRSGPPANICLTLRPFTGRELRALLHQARELLRQGHMGRLQRMAAAFTTQTPATALLHYAYQRGREGDRQPALALGRSLEQSQWTLPGIAYPAGARPGRLPLGEGDLAQSDGRPDWFSPLLDLLEFMKVLG